MNAAVVPALPLGARVAVRGHAGDEVSSKRVSINHVAGTRPSPHASPRRGEEANARSPSP